jgi:hypothetical protein
VNNRVLLAALAGTALAVAACGSDGGDAGAARAGGSGSTAGAAVQQADAAVKKFSAEQPPLSLPRLTKPIPKDVRLAVLTCANVPSCQAETDGAVAAAKRLGWSVKQYQTALTPDAYAQTWTSMLQGNPTAIIYSAIFPDANIAAALNTVRQRKISTVSISPHTADAPPHGTGPAQATVAGPAMYRADGVLMGHVVNADARGPAKTVFVWDPNFGAVHGPVREGFTNTVKQAGGSVQTLDISIVNVGQSVPGEVVSYLQSHPDIKYLAFVVSDFDVGVAQALKGAGLSGKVKIVSRAPQAANLVAVRQGSELAEVADENVAGGWRSVDDMIRIISGTPVVEVDPVGWQQIFLKSTVTQTRTAPPTPGTPDSFLKAWGLASG